VYAYTTFGTFTATLTVTDDVGASGTAAVVIDVRNDPPTAALSISPAAVLTGVPVTFSGAGSLDADGPIAKFEWDLDGNGTFETDSGATATVVRSFPNRMRVTVKLRVKNAGQTTLGFVVGGRQRGPRDNRFVFKVSRNGTPVAIKDAPDFGGISFYKALKPGEGHELAVDLRSWADLAIPGHYAVDVTYEGELAKDGVMPTTATDRKNLWDVALTGQGGILVQ